MNYLKTLLFLVCMFFGLNLQSITSAQSADNSNQEIKIGVYENDINYDKFKLPAKQYMGHAWFTFQLANLTEEAVEGMVQRAVESNAYGGYLITPDRGRIAPGGDGATTAPNATYLDEEFFRLYKITINEGLKHELPMDILYDELQFPTGMAGGLFYEATYQTKAEKNGS